MNKKKNTVEGSDAINKILDTHLGSQSSRLAAWEMGLDFYGCEIEKDYFEDGCQRFTNETKQLSLWVG
jgi:site-specific DNA-methyltransferase (adenine-specific)